MAVTCFEARKTLPVLKSFIALCCESSSSSVDDRFRGWKTFPGDGFSSVGKYENASLE